VLEVNVVGGVSLAAHGAGVVTRAQRKVLFVSVVMGGALILDACKQPLRPTDSAALVSDSGSEIASEILVATQNTTLKKYLLQSATQRSTDVCPIPEGTKITVESLRHEGIGHWRLFKLTEVQLPTGEIAQRPREFNESVTAATPAGETRQVAPFTLPSPAPSAQADGQNELEPSTQATQVPTPAELLKCKLLENNSFLVFAEHFKRESLPEKKNSVAQEPDPENNMGSST